MNPNNQPDGCNKRWAGGGDSGDKVTIKRKTRMKEVTREKDNSQMVVTGDEPMGNAKEVGRQRARARARRKPDSDNKRGSCHRGWAEGRKQEVERKRKENNLIWWNDSQTDSCDKRWAELCAKEWMTSLEKEWLQGRISREEWCTEITERGNRLKEWSEAKKSSRRRPIGEWVWKRYTEEDKSGQATGNVKKS